MSEQQWQVIPLNQWWWVEGWFDAAEPPTTVSFKQESREHAEALGAVLNYYSDHLNALESEVARLRASLAAAEEKAKREQAETWRLYDRSNTEWQERLDAAEERAAQWKAAAEVANRALSTSEETPA